MITLIGQEDTREYPVALRIKEAFERQWKGISNSPIEQDDIKIFASAKICGYKVSDIDVIVCGKLRQGRRFNSKKVIKDQNRNAITGQAITVENFLIAIEVKDHDASGVKFEGETVYVKYKNKWHNASDQNINQVHTLKNYFQDRKINSWVHRLLVMNGLEDTNIPSVLPKKFSINDFFTEIAILSPPYRRGRDWVLNSFKPENIHNALNVPLFKRILPTQLDRKKMDRIASRKNIDNDWLNEFGKKQLIFRGHGGTGKTVMLLQAAYKAFDEDGMRTLFLTYNRALTADIMRSMSLMNIPSSIETGGIAIKTVMSLIYSWLHYLGLLDEGNELGFEGYNEQCKEFIEMILSGAIEKSDIENIKIQFPEIFHFDQLIIDEGQDWPQEEVDLIKLIYGPEIIAVADGIDQLIRGDRPDWTRGVSKEQRKTIKLDRCLRMKNNLGHFANVLAKQAGINWKIEPNNEAGGGKIYILNKPYDLSSELHSTLLKSSLVTGNSPIDFLFCVPPSNIVQDRDIKSCKLVNMIKQTNCTVWDGTNTEQRKDFPRDSNTYRVVQYSSCRGLEGWVVVAEHLDSFWNFQHNLAKNNYIENQDFKTKEDFAAEQAWKWCLIPLTRPIDTLVITIEDENSPFSLAIKNAANECEDIVTWL